LEAGSSVDVVIRDNVIRNCRSRGISVTSCVGHGQIAPAGAHRDITITGNRIENSPAPQILVTSTDQLVIENNTIRHPENPVLEIEQAIELKNCKHAEIRDNRIDLKQGAEGDAANRASQRTHWGQKERQLCFKNIT
jgi:polygalacturonase